MDDDQLIAKLQRRFDPAAAGDLNATYQFLLHDADDHHLVIEGGNLNVHAGHHTAPDVTIESDTATLIALIKKELNAMQALLGGRVKVKGDIGLAARLPKLFGKRND
ncbi:MULTISPECIES: SCP2 sterol-binding domain-containing protein [unclassified Salinicola]|uniref:SCP2 sterol-binding domain-containing protein n=1 Tax=unclassified Salinicola TaxID=2634022 RepID=UPI001A8D959E|nr:MULTISPECIES: SCP2 sterol-binding domain-containing protein [unclassified Salinicola]MCE3025789.1 SCP2 sterol-binding domain-containing protein [Salinicola sp. DM10]WIX34718.1 SCP2 sterol-binding domain-containing protein [Salinicola sp. JS01]